MIRSYLIIEKLQISKMAITVVDRRHLFYHLLKQKNQVGLEI